uniref:Tyr recombinase domain-containing protein n=1 Tax=Amphimedon queenslandica TaxID=400682 RepID=A0A1X7TEY2_AMPQE
MGSRASSTVTKYTRAFLKWQRWTETMDDVKVFPVNPLHFALYLQHVGEQSQSKAAVEEATNAVSWICQTAGLDPIAQDPFIKMTLAGLQRNLAKPKTKKEPVTPEMLREMIESLGLRPSLSEVRTVAIAVTAFHGFFRFDEVVRIRCCDVKFGVDHMAIKVLSSKTDQYRQGDEVVIARADSPHTCPVARLEQYYSMAGINHFSTERLFRAIVKTKEGEKLRTSGSISYTRVREILLEKLRSLGYEPSEFGTHNFRAGGATTAANQGVPDRLFKRHGRWKSETAKDGYIKDSLEARLEVSKKLHTNMRG